MDKLIEFLHANEFWNTLLDGRPDDEIEEFLIKELDYFAEMAGGMEQIRHILSGF